MYFSYTLQIKNKYLYLQKFILNSQLEKGIIYYFLNKAQLQMKYANSWAVKFLKLDHIVLKGCN
jgi:hypothetical protein